MNLYLFMTKVVTKVYSKVENSYEVFLYFNSNLKLLRKHRIFLNIPFLLQFSLSHRILRNFRDWSEKAVN